MNTQAVDNFIITNHKLFPDEQIPQIREALLNVDDNKMFLVASTNFDDPTVMLIISIFTGTFGVDRFLLGDIGLGVLKLLTGGVCGVMTIVDWFLIQNKTKEKNSRKLYELLYYTPYGGMSGSSCNSANNGNNGGSYNNANTYNPNTANTEYNPGSGADVNIQNNDNNNTNNNQQ